MRNGVDAPNGWSGLLGGYASQVQGSARNAEPPLPAADSLAAPMAYIFRLNTGLMSRAIDGLTDEQAWTRPTPQTNAMLWIIAHAVTVRASMLKMLGLAEVRSIIAERETVEVTCEFCNRAYHYDSVDAEQLFAASHASAPGLTRH